MVIPRPDIVFMLRNAGIGIDRTKRGTIIILPIVHIIIATVDIQFFIAIVERRPFVVFDKSARADPRRECSIGSEIPVFGKPDVNDGAALGIIFGRRVRKHFHFVDAIGGHIAQHIFQIVPAEMSRPPVYKHIDGSAGKVQIAMLFQHAGDTQ